MIFGFVQATIKFNFGDLVIMLNRSNTYSKLTGEAKEIKVRKWLE